MRKSKGGAPQAPRERQAGAAKNHERGWGGGVRDDGTHELIRKYLSD